MSIPTQHKVLSLESKQGQFVVKAADTGKPGPGEVLIKVESTALNPADWKIQALGLLVETYPAVLGFDAAGTIVQLGEGVTSFALGDRVFTQGSADFTIQSVYGTFRQYFVAPAQFLGRIPNNISFDEAATLPSGFATAALPLYKQDAIKLTPPWVEDGAGKYAGKPLLVLGGATSMGQFAIQFARLSGFSPIVTTASLHNTDFLKSLGATHILDRKLPGETIKAEATKIAGSLFGIVYDAVSEEDTLALGYALTAPGGDFATLLAYNPIRGRDDAGTGKRVHEVRGFLQLPVNHALSVSLLAASTKLLESGALKPNRVEVLQGGLAAVVGGLERLKNNQVSGVKLVVRPHETA